MRSFPCKAHTATLSACLQATRSTSHHQQGCPQQLLVYPFKVRDQTLFFWSLCNRSVDMMFYVAPSRQGLAVFLRNSHTHHWACRMHVFFSNGKNRSTHDEELLCCTGHRGTAGTQCLAYKYKNAFPRHHFTSSRVTILLAEAKTPLTVRVIQWWPTPALTVSRKLKAKKEKI